MSQDLKDAAFDWVTSFAVALGNTPEDEHTGKLGELAVELAGVFELLRNEGFDAGQTAESPYPRTDYPIPTLRNEVWNAALAGVAQSNKTQAEYEAFHAFLVWASSQKRTDPPIGARFECDECAVGQDCQKHDGVDRG